MLDPGQQPIINETNLPASLGSAVIFIIFYFALSHIYLALLITVVCACIECGINVFSTKNITPAHIAVRLITSLIPVLIIFYVFGNMLNMWE